MDINFSHFETTEAEPFHLSSAIGSVQQWKASPRVRGHGKASGILILFVLVSSIAALFMILRCASLLKTDKSGGSRRLAVGGAPEDTEPSQEQSPGACDPPEEGWGSGGQYQAAQSSAPGQAGASPSGPSHRHFTMGGSRHLHAQYMLTDAMEFLRTCARPHRGFREQILSAPCRSRGIGGRRFYVNIRLTEVLNRSPSISMRFLEDARVTLENTIDSVMSALLTSGEAAAPTKVMFTVTRSFFRHTVGKIIVEVWCDWVPQSPLGD